MRRQVSRQLGGTLSPPGTQSATASSYLAAAEMFSWVCFPTTTPQPHPAPLSAAVSHHQYGDMLSTDSRFSRLQSLALPRQLLLMAERLHPPSCFSFCPASAAQVDAWVETHVRAQVHTDFCLLLLAVNTTTLSKSLWLFQQFSSTLFHFSLFFFVVCLFSFSVFSRLWEHERIPPPQVCCAGFPRFSLPT